MEAAVRKHDRLQIGLEIPSFSHGPIPTGSLCETYIRLVRVVGRGGSEGEIRSVRRDARH